MNVIVISIFSLFVLSQLPWWFVVITSSMAGLISKNYITSILNGFLCGALPWLLMFIYKLNAGGELLITRVSSLRSSDFFLAESSILMVFSILEDFLVDFGH